VDQSTLVAVLAIAAVVVVAMLMRGGKGADDGMTITRPEESVSEGASIEPDTLEVEPEDDWDENEVVAVTSDGYAFLPDRHAVRLVPPAEEGEGWKTGQSAGHKRGEAAIAMSWRSGDFTGARVQRGGGDEPWRLEALGRDGEYTVFGFETREAAAAALGLFESRDLIRVGRDEDGNPVPASAEQFAEARRIYEETEQALAMEPGPDDERGA
jgi:hypothetical protein